MNAFVRRALGDVALTYLEPWKDKTRAKLFIAVIIGCFAAGILAMYLTYTMAAMGFGAAVAYHAVRIVLMSSVTVPVTFWMLARRGGAAILLLLQLAGIGFLVHAGSSPWLASIGFSFVCGPYWPLFSQRYAMNQSRFNFGNETALLLYMMVLCGAAGVYVAGVMLARGLHDEAMYGGGLLMIVGTVLFMTRLPYRDECKRAIALMSWRKPSCLLTAFTGFQGVAFEFGIATWMSLVGITPLAAGVSLALRPVMGLFLTPVVGNLLQKGRVNLTMIGGLAMVVGWLMMLPAAEHQALLLPAMTIMTIANNLLGPAEVSRWYKRRSSAAIVAREFLLGVGRMPALATMVPVIFFAPTFYPLYGLAAGSAFVWGVARSSRKITLSKLLGRGRRRTILPDPHLPLES